MTDQEDSTPVDTSTAEEMNFRQAMSDSSTRFSTWFGLFVLSCVNIASMLLQRHLWSGAWGWAVAVAVMSMVLSFAGYMAYLRARALFMGQPFELYLAGFILALWVSGLPVIMNPSNNIAVGVNEIVDANIYFTSWGAFGCSAMLCGNTVRELYGFDLMGTVSPIARTRLGKWYMLVIASLIVLIESARAHIAEHCEEEVMKVAPKCKQTNYAIASGVVGFVFATVITAYSWKNGPLKLLHEWEAAVVLFIIYALALGYVTAADGPGSSVGNLYFSTWACFILSVWIFGECHMETLANKEQQQSAVQGDDTSDLEDLELQETDLNN